MSAAAAAAAEVGAGAAAGSREERRVGSFVRTFHAVSGTLYAVGDDTLIIKVSLVMVPV